MTPNYPFNCWYVAATSDEVGAGLLARRLLDRPVVLYRRSSGDVVAMEDRCVHRAYPLSEGRRDGDRGGLRLPRFQLRPRRLPGRRAVSRKRPARRPGAHLSSARAVSVRVDLARRPGERPRCARRRGCRGTAMATGWASTTEVLRVEANYLLLHEHYLDLTDVFVMHPEVVPPDIEVLPPLDEVEVSERSVSYSRTTPPSRLAAVGG